VPAERPTPPDGRPPAPAIVVSNVSKGFRRAGAASSVEALRDVSLEIPADSFVTLLGPSGCGKTTLLRLISGLIRPDAGLVSVAGAPPRPGPHVGFVFQSFRLIPWQRVRDNVAFGLAVIGMPRAERRARADHYLELVGLTRFADAWPHELSGGMKQRAALARALATDPDVLLMDEPFASLDAQTRELMQIELMRLWSERPRVVVFVTHSVDEAIVLADRIALMRPRPGRIVETLDVPLPRPRRDSEIRGTPTYVALRHHLWERLRDMVVSDPASDFYSGAP
jgi:NitT/TauT family transport system ATP-binding protein